MATTGDLTKIETLLGNTDVVDSCTGGRTNSKRNFYKLTNFKIFAALLKVVPKGCNDTVLPDPILKNYFVESVTFEENTRKPYNDNFCLCTALALPLHGNERPEEETSKLFNLSLKKTGGIDPANFRGVCMEGVGAVQDFVQADIFFYDVDIVNGSMVGEFATRSVGNYSNMATLSGFKSHIC